MAEKTREQLLAEVASLKLQLSQRARATPNPRSSSERTVVTETPQQTTIKTTPVAPTGKLFPAPQTATPTVDPFMTGGPVGRVAVRTSLLPKAGKSTPEEILGQIIGIKSILASGVDSAAYGDKRTDFRSLVELRQILAALEEELDELLGVGGRTRQIRMTTQWDKGL